MTTYKFVDKMGDAKCSRKHILIENRIYQNDDVLIETPTADIIDPIIEKIKEFDKIIADLR